MTNTPDDRCKCKKPRGAWGHARWHHVIIDKDRAENMAAAEYRQTIGESEPMTEDERDSTWKHILARYQSYIGVKIAYEECPEGLAHIQKQCHEEAQRRMAEGGS